MKHSSKVFKISLSLSLMIFVLTMTPASTFFQIIKPAEAAALTNVAVVPSNNIVNTRSIYEIFFKTVTTGTIKTIEMSFPSGFDVSIATKLIEKSGIGSGSLSAPSSTTLIYTVSNPVSVPAGTSIRFEIGRITNSNTAGSFMVSITTEDTVATIIDGPTSSGSFPIKDITGNDVSPSFMIRKTLLDDDAGHAHGWDPAGFITSFVITDSDFSGSPDGVFVQILSPGGERCEVLNIVPSQNRFDFQCDFPPPNNRVLHYVITKLPPNVVTSTSLSSSQPSSLSSSIPSSPFDSLQVDK